VSKKQQAKTTQPQRRSKTLLQKHSPKAQQNAVSEKIQPQRRSKTLLQKQHSHKAQQNAVT